MKCELHLQDPTDGGSLYLFETLVAAMSEAVSGKAMFAFASRNGVEELLLDPDVQGFLSTRNFSIVVGLDAITNRAALERLQVAQVMYGRLDVKVFRNPSEGLFHPKIAHFVYPNGTESLIVGSGNFTPGGLRENFEAYSVVRSARGERLDTSTWDRFLERHAVNLTSIDDSALERAAKNVYRGGGRKRRDVEPDVTTTEEELPRPDAVETDRILVAMIPRAGGRWHQVHFNQDVVRSFFRVKPNSAERVFLQERLGSGEAKAPEQPRPCVLSRINLNYKIELGARGGEAYPTGTLPPIAVFRERGLRTFEYMMLMPKEPGYTQMHKLTEERPRVGRGLARVVLRGSDLRAAWPACPLLVTPPGE